MNKYEFAWRFGWRFPGFVLGFWVCMLGLAALISWTAGQDHGPSWVKTHDGYFDLGPKQKPLQFKPLIPEPKKPLSQNSKPASWRQL